MKLAAYLRVSTDRQAERGQGLGVQEKAIRAWARANGHRIAEVHRDAGVSGANGLDVREGLYGAVEAVKLARVDGLAVYRLDRIARLLTVQEAVLGKVWEHGGRVFTVDGGEVERDDPADPMRTAMRQMAGVFAQLEKGLIVQRMQAGRRAKAEAGGFAYGSPPYGWRSEEGRLVPVEAEQAVIARIRELHAAGESMREIARRLETDGVPTKRPGGRWDSRTVGRILARE